MHIELIEIPCVAPIPIGHDVDVHKIQEKHHPLLELYHSWVDVGFRVHDLTTGIVYNVADANDDAERRALAPFSGTVTQCEVRGLTTKLHVARRSEDK
jgi:hypothetical protein